MAFLTSGGSTVTTSEIVDGTIVNADIAAAAAIAQSKLAGTGNGNTDLVAIETSTSTPYSLTTVAGQRVVVLAKWRCTGAAGNGTVELRYNGVAKDTTDMSTAATPAPGSCMYTEVPGAATADITVVPSVGNITQLVIMVFKFK